MKPTQAEIAIAVTLSDGTTSGVHLFSAAYAVELDGDLGNEDLAEMLSEAADAAGNGTIVGWACAQRLATLAHEMDDDPEQEAALETLFGRACE